MKKNQFFILAFVFLLLLVVSCNSGVLVDRNKKIPDATWKSSDIIKFSVNIPDTMQVYNFFINIRNSSDYKYSNIFLFLKTFYPNRMFSMDTVECTLADDSGKWLGRQRGKLIDNRILFRQGVRFRQTGTYSFEFEQAMREPELSGIEDVGIRIEKFEAAK